ncbi:hypothetical protein V8G54_030691, partial [Vigna mungo]
LVVPPFPANPSSYCSWNSSVWVRLGLPLLRNENLVRLWTERGRPSRYCSSEVRVPPIEGLWLVFAPAPTIKLNQHLITMDKIKHLKPFSRAWLRLKRRNCGNSGTS